MHTLSGLILFATSLLPAQQILQTLSSWDANRDFAPMGDRNGDGYEDVLVVSLIYVGPFWVNIDYELRLLSGRDGTLLRRGPRWAYPDQAECFPTGDHDNDGIRDYICLDTDYANAFRRLSVRSGFDDHVLWMVQTPFTTSWASRVIGDLDVNGDGQLDVVVGDLFGNSSLGEIWAYNHQGNLLYHKIGSGLGNGLGLNIARLGDVNGDGCDDYIAGLSDPTRFGAVAVLSGPTGQILRVVFGQNVGDDIGYGCIGCGDLDDDGVNDFAAGCGLSPAPGSVQAFSGRTGQRLFATYSGSIGDRFGLVLRAADYDHDGIDDIISAQNSMRVVSGRDGSIFATSNPPSAFEIQPLRTPIGFPRLLASNPVLGALLMSAAPHASEVLGPGCTIGAPTNAPLLGMRELTGFDRRLTLSHAEPGTVAFLLLGLADYSNGPINLAPMGLPSCSVHPNLVAVACFLTGTGIADAGYARHDFSISSAAAFGLGIDAQWVTLDQNASLAALSQAIRFAIRP